MGIDELGVGELGVGELGVEIVRLRLAADSAADSVLTFDIAARRVLNDRILRQFEIVQFGFGEPSYFAGTSRVDSVYCGFNAATPVGY